MREYVIKLVVLGIIIMTIILGLMFLIGLFYQHSFDCNGEFTVPFDGGMTKGVCIHLPMIQSVDKSGYNTVADYGIYKRIFSPFELDMLCK